MSEVQPPVLTMDEGTEGQLRDARDPRTAAADLDRLATASDPAILLALIENPATSGDTLRRIARTPRLGVRKALLDSPRCPLVSAVAEDRLAFEGVDIGLFVDEASRRAIARALIGTAHRAETALLFSDPTLRVLDCLRTLHSLFTIHGGKKRDRKLNRHDYLRFLADFNARGGRQEALNLPFITLLNAIRILGQDDLVRALTAREPTVATRALRLLEAIAGNQAGEEGARQRVLLGRWMARQEDWPARLHDYLDRKYRRRAHRRRNRPPRTLAQARLAPEVRQFNRRSSGEGIRLHLPRTERELQELGALMANCIGSDHNVQDAVDGRHLVALLHRRGARRRGVTCQYSPTGKLLQVRGFANGEADPQLAAIADVAMREILQAELQRQATATAGGVQGEASDVSAAQA